jgi:hypothetical protein
MISLINVANDGFGIKKVLLIYGKDLRKDSKKWQYN